MIINIDSYHSRKYGQSSGSRGKKCEIRLYLEGNSTTELKKKDCAPSRVNFLICRNELHCTPESLSGQFLPN